MKKRIKMLKSTLGSEDGFTTKRYNAEKTYYMEDSLSTVFVDEMKVAEYIAPVMRRRILEIESKPPEETPEDGIAESSVSLVDSPKHWQGLTIREKDSLVEVKIKDVLRGGKVQLSSGEIISYQKIRKEWEIVNGD